MFSIFAVICVLGNPKCNILIDYNQLYGWEPFSTYSECIDKKKEAHFTAKGEVYGKQSTTRLICSSLSTEEILDSVSLIMYNNGILKEA